MVYTALWDLNDVLNTVTENATYHRLRPGSVAFLFAALQVMSDRWRWEQYYNDEDWDTIQAYIGQVTEDIMVENIDCNAVTQCLAGSSGAGTPSSGGYGGAAIAQSTRDEGLIPETWTCDNDHAYGMARGIVQYLDSTITDILQKIETATNPVELAAEVGDNIPIVSWGSTALDVASWMQDNLKEEYDAAWTITVQDDIACEIWCKILQNCNLSFTEIFSVYIDLALQSPPSLDNSTWDEWAEWFISLALTSLTDTQKVAIGHLTALAAVAFGSKVGPFMPSGIRSIGLTIQLLQDELSNDWSILCPDCPDDWVHTEDMLLSNGGYVVDNITGVTWDSEWAAGIGWQARDGRGTGTTDYRRSVSIRREFSQAINIVKMEITYNMSQEGDDPNVRIFKGSQHSGIDQTLTTEDTRKGEGLVLSTGDIDVTGAEYAIFAITDQAQTEAALKGYATVLSVKYWGKGYNPFI